MTYLLLYHYHFSSYIVRFSNICSFLNKHNRIGIVLLKIFMFLMENVVRDVQTELQQLINQGNSLIRKEETESADKVSE